MVTDAKKESFDWLSRWMNKPVACLFPRDDYDKIDVIYQLASKKCHTSVSDSCVFCR